MIDKLISFFKDLMIYLVPGIVVNVCILINLEKLNWIFAYKDEYPRIELLLLILSFIVGFFITQFQISIYHRLDKNKNSFQVLSKENKLLEEVFNKKFGILNLQDVNNFDFRNFCYQYVLNNGSDKINFLIQRADTLLLFSISMFIPSIIIISSISNFLFVNIICKIICFTLLICFAMFTLLKASNHFKQDKEKRIFFSFLSIVVEGKEKSGIDQKL
jgi:RsiW-degrading membrane proteinase PrsW (M82 family)